MFFANLKNNTFGILTEMRLLRVFIHWLTFIVTILKLGIEETAYIVKKKFELF